VSTGGDPRVLIAASEVHPLVKTGGLADVCGSLPGALRALGVDARVLVPAYPGVIEALGAEELPEDVPGLADLPRARLCLGTLPDTDTPVYALACPGLFDRPGGPYLDPQGRDWPDNALRFGSLSRVAALFGRRAGLAGWTTDVVHCNDWQTALAAAYLAHEPDRHARAVLTVHNLAYQGNFPRELLGRLGLPASSFGLHGVEFFGRLSFMKAGLVYADHIVAVSPSYGREIQTSTLGYGMEGVVASRRDRLSGILNGIDVGVWDPSRDPHLPRPYDRYRLTDKAASRRALQERLGLAPDAAVAILGVVARLTWQKGVDLVLDLLPRLLREPVQIALLGSGDPGFESRWRAAAADLPGRVGVVIGYDESLAHLIEAGSDIFLMPSRFEPCGLNQMYSMRYGTPPVVRYTGGLADSVCDATPRSLNDGAATGFVFEGASSAELLACLLRALLSRRDRSTWRAIQSTGMVQDFSWERSAREYHALYARVLGGSPIL
jgi:starch synthase